MSIVLDLIIVLIVAICVILSAKKGFVRTLIEVVGFFAAISLAISLSTPVSDFIYEKTVHSAIINSVEESVAEGTNSTIDTVFENLPSFVVNNKFLNVEKSEISQTITDEAISDTQIIADTISNNYIRPPVTKLFSVFASILLTIVFLVAVKFIAKAVNKLFSFSLVGTINKVLGGILGAIKGCFVAVVFCLIVTLLVSFTKDGFLFFTHDAINSSHIFKFLINLIPFI